MNHPAFALDDLTIQTKFAHGTTAPVEQTPASGYPGVMDDLIFSGAGSGCRGDDEDECTPPFESGSGDDLITPVYVPPTKQPTTPQKEKETSITERTCDDEDCVHGSGDSGEVTETFTSSTSKGTGKHQASHFVQFLIPAISTLCGQMLKCFF